MSIAISSNVNVYSNMYKVNMSKKTTPPSTPTTTTLKSTISNNIGLALPETELPEEDLKSGELLGQIQFDSNGQEIHAFAYKDKDFSEENPVVKVYSKNPTTGEWTKTTVNLNSIDKNNMSVLEAYGAGHALEALGKVSTASAMTLTATFNRPNDFKNGYFYDDLLNKYDIKSVFTKDMQTQYKFGNMQGYLHHKQVFDAFFAD